MMTALRHDFLTMPDWHFAVFEGQEIILRCSSALAQLDLFLGYIERDNTIEIYSKQPSVYLNVDYKLVNSFDNIDYVIRYGLACTSISRTFNDMLEEYWSPNCKIDGQALIEGLAKYYHCNNKSYDGLTIYPQNFDSFNKIKECAYDFY